MVLPLFLLLRFLLGTPVDSRYGRGRKEIITNLIQRISVGPNGQSAPSVHLVFRSVYHHPHDHQQSNSILNTIEKEQLRIIIALLLVIWFSVSLSHLAQLVAPLSGSNSQLLIFIFLPPLSLLTSINSLCVVNILQSYKNLCWLSVNNAQMYLMQDQKKYYFK